MSDYDPHPTPTPVASGDAVATRIEVGHFSACAATTTGKLICRGNGRNQKLARPSSTGPRHRSRLSVGPAKPSSTPRPSRRRPRPARGLARRHDRRQGLQLGRRCPARRASSPAASRRVSPDITAAADRASCRTSRASQCLRSSGERIPNRVRRAGPSQGHAHACAIAERRRLLLGHELHRRALHGPSGLASKSRVPPR